MSQAAHNLISHFTHAYNYIINHTLCLSVLIIIILRPDGVEHNIMDRENA